MKKLTGMVALALAPVLGTAAVASAYPPGAPTLTLSVTTVTVGGSFTATLSPCELGETITVSIEGGDSGSDTCTGTGGGTARGIMEDAGASASVTLTAPT